MDEKRFVRKTADVGDIISSLDNCTFTDAIDKLKKLEYEYVVLKGWKDLAFVVSQGEYQTYLYVEGYRLETDKEFEARVRQEKLVQERLDARERKRIQEEKALYEHLRSKYG